MKNIILTSSQVENPIDDQHCFISVGLNCWGTSSQSAKEAFKNCKANAPKSAKYCITRVAHKSVQVDPVDGSLSWDQNHDASTCPFCTAGKGIRVHID
jgi:hypothetical protein